MLCRNNTVEAEAWSCVGCGWRGTDSDDSQLVPYVVPSGTERKREREIEKEMCMCVHVHSKNKFSEKQNESTQVKTKNLFHFGPKLGKSHRYHTILRIQNKISLKL